MGINHKINRKGEWSPLERRSRTHGDHILDRIRGTFHDVTVSSARCVIFVRGLPCTCLGVSILRFPIGAKNENLTLAQFDPDCGRHRNSVGRAAGRDWKTGADRASVPINSAIL